MRHLLKKWTDLLLDRLGVGPTAHDDWAVWVACGLVVVIVVAVDLLLQWTIVPGVRRVVERTRLRWDDTLFSPRVLRCGCHVVSAVLLALMLPVVFEERSEARPVMMRLLHIYIVVSGVRFISAAI